MFTWIGTNISIGLMHTGCYSLSTRSRLRSATGHKLVVPATRLSTYGRRPFAVAGPVLWNSLPDYLTDPEISLAQFRAQLKTFMFARY